MLWACSVARLVARRSVRVKASIYNGDSDERSIRLEQTVGVMQHCIDGNLFVSGNRMIGLNTGDWRKTSYQDVTDHGLSLDNITSLELPD